VLSHRRALVERKMNRLEVGEVVIGTVRGIKPYGAFIDIGGVSGLLHISEISHDHIDTPHTVFNVNDEVKVMIIDLDAERGRISLSTKQLEPEPGDMVKNPDVVYEKAEEMAAKYRDRMNMQQSGESMPAAAQAEDDVVVDEIPSATEDDVVDEIPSATEDDVVDEIPSATEDDVVDEVTDELATDDTEATPLTSEDEAVPVEA
jgi:small subunit ribosomal protein S1